jgi:hypothetical protein
MKRAQHDIVDDLRTYRRRWHLQCPACQAKAASPDWRDRREACPEDAHGMCSCPSCQNRTRDTFKQPAPWDTYRGGPVPAW